MTQFSQLRVNLEASRKALDLALANLDLYMTKTWARERVWRLMADASQALQAADANMAALSNLQHAVDEK